MIALKISLRLMKKAPVIRGLFQGRLYQIKKRRPTATHELTDQTPKKLTQIKKRMSAPTKFPDQY